MRDKDLARVLPSKFSWRVTVISEHEALSGRHLHRLLIKVELKFLLAQLKRDGISLGRHQEVERSIVDVVCDRSAEGLYLLTAENDVETCLLSRRDHLA